MTLRVFGSPVPPVRVEAGPSAHVRHRTRVTIRARYIVKAREVRDGLFETLYRSSGRAAVEQDGRGLEDSEGQSDFWRGSPLIEMGMKIAILHEFKK